MGRHTMGATSNLTRSPLADLKAMRERLAAEQEITWCLPAWAANPDVPDVWVSFRPLTYRELRAVGMRSEKAKPGARADVELGSAISKIIDTCTGVWMDIDGERAPMRLDGEPELTGFDKTLAEAIGLDEDANAADTVKALFIREGDIIVCWYHLQEESGFAQDQADREAVGE